MSRLSKSAPNKQRVRPSTPSTLQPATSSVEAVEGRRKLPHFDWHMEAGLDKNFRKLGTLLARLNLELYQAADGDGLLLVDNGTVHRIATAKDLSPLLIDNVRIRIFKDGKYRGERISQSILSDMLGSKAFLGHFRRVENVVTTPIVLPDYQPSRPGFNDEGGILYLGDAVTTDKGLRTINQFLDVMEWASNADRTNTVAA